MEGRPLSVVVRGGPQLKLQRVGNRGMFLEQLSAPQRAAKGRQAASAVRTQTSLLVDRESPWEALRAALVEPRQEGAAGRGAIKRLELHIRVKTPIFDFCHRLREASEQRKRFVIVPSTHETRGAAQVLLQHGLVAGFRDFNNNRAFAVELKYFQNEPTINTIEPCSFDGRAEFIWSPKMMRRLMNHYGMHNKLVIYICRTHDGRVIDHIQAVREQIGGKGLLMCF